jgi:hypothetical protein
MTVIASLLGAVKEMDSRLRGNDGTRGFRNLWLALQIKIRRLQARQKSHFCRVGVSLSRKFPIFANTRND